MEQDTEERREGRKAGEQDKEERREGEQKGVGGRKKRRKERMERREKGRREKGRKTIIFPEHSNSGAVHTWHSNSAYVALKQRHSMALKQ